MASSSEKIFLKYKIALDKLKMKFNSLYLEYATLGENNPIEHLKYRIKKIDSIEEKLNKTGYELTEENIDKLNDIVGVRIVCSFLSDMEEIIDFINSDPEINVLNVKDYIKRPKSSGYMSYHMIVEIPVMISNQVTTVKAEIQVRTIAMDMWASLEHKIWYKKGIQLPKEIMDEIDTTNEICNRMDIVLDDLIRNVNHNNQKDNMLSTKEMKGTTYDITMLKYEAALKIMEGKINNIYEEYERIGSINPIEHIISRIKSKDRILAKLKSNEHDFSVENMQNYINDIAGIRIVCSFQSDLKEIIEIIKSDSSLQIIKEKDYINYPKASGYMGYHLLVLVPIHLKNGTTYVKVEIQLRTIAMEMWASVEHKLCYKKDVDPSVKDELKKLSTIILTIDNNMNKIIEESKLLVERKRKKKKLVQS